MSPDTSAFLLASKSNYQNIVEGNHSHLGLQYPEHLSTNLTSKRTSHKIAEQGRRNRINNALAEMAGLLPPVSADGGASCKEQTSKASTVELAIDYIKQLTRELGETQARLKAAEEALENVGTAAATKRERKRDKGRGEEDAGEVDEDEEDEEDEGEEGEGGGRRSMGEMKANGDPATTTATTTTTTKTTKTTTQVTVSATG